MIATMIRQVAAKGISQFVMAPSVELELEIRFRLNVGIFDKNGARTNVPRVGGARNERRTTAPSYLRRRPGDTGERTVPAIHLTKAMATGVRNSG
jgi:hypothetical protein